MVSRGISGHHVTGLLDLTLDESSVKSRISKTSFYGTGLEGVQEAVMAEVRRLSWIDKSPKSAQPALTASQQRGQLELVGVLRNFDRFARQLAQRHDNRPSIAIQDEYDVQDLVHALLRCLFDDVRPEEVTPSYAGASSRMDFLLKKECTVIEVKHSSGNLRDKQIGEQLIIDIQRYKTHPDCRVLLCFVYDPGSHVRNPAGLENDLSGKNGSIDVQVIVTPK